MFLHCALVEVSYFPHGFLVLDGKKSECSLVNLWKIDFKVYLNSCRDHDGELPHHVARKKIPYVSSAGER